MEKDMVISEVEKGSGTNNLFQSEAGAELANAKPAPPLEASKQALAAMPNLEVHELSRVAEKTNQNAVGNATNELKKGRFSEKSESLLKNSFEFSPDALNGMVKDTNNGLKSAGKELKVTHSDDKKTTVLNLADSKGKVLDSVVLSPQKEKEESAIAKAAVATDRPPQPQIDPVYPPDDNSRYDRISTPDGPAILARSGDTIFAGKGDIVWAYSGARVYADAGSKVRAFQGSWVNALPGSDVHIHNGQVLIEKGTMVNFESVGAFQNLRYPQGLQVMANGRMVYMPYGSTVTNLYGPFWIKP